MFDGIITSYSIRTLLNRRRQAQEVRLHTLSDMDKSACLYGHNGVQSNLVSNALKPVVCMSFLEPGSDKQIKLLASDPTDTIHGVVPLHKTLG